MRRDASTRPRSLRVPMPPKSIDSSGCSTIRRETRRRPSRSSGDTWPFALTRPTRGASRNTSWRSAGYSLAPSPGRNREAAMARGRATSLPPAARRVVAEARRAGVRLVRFLYTDNGGITRGKATHLESLAHRLTDGIGLTVAMQAMNMLDQLQSVEGLGPVGEIRLVPDPQTFTVLPYAPHAAAMTSDMCTLQGAPWEACPRAFVKRQIAAVAAAGFSVRAAFECEFTLAVKHADGAFTPL